MYAPMNEWQYERRVAIGAHKGIRSIISTEAVGGLQHPSRHDHDRGGGTR